jgi:hypothetical protein
MTAAGGGAINLPKPSFANFALATHYYNYVGNISLAGLFVPFQQVRACALCMLCLLCMLCMATLW